jgi:hypothetical protein
MFPQQGGPRRERRATSRRSRILAAREIDIGCFWTLGQVATGHRAFPAGEIARAVAATRRRRG